MTPHLMSQFPHLGSIGQKERTGLSKPSPDFHGCTEMISSAGYWRRKVMVMTETSISFIALLGGRRVRVVQENQAWERSLCREGDRWWGRDRAEQRESVGSASSFLRVPVEHAQVDLWGYTTHALTA